MLLRYSCRFVGTFNRKLRAAVGSRYRTTNPLEANTKQGSGVKQPHSFKLQAQNLSSNMATEHKVAELSPDVYWMGLDTLRVSRSKLHQKTRDSVRQRMAQVISSENTGVVLLQGGHLEPYYNTDTEGLFRQEPFFHYMFGVEEEGFVGAFDLRTGEATLFMPRLPESYAVWMGPLRGPEDFKAKYAVDHVYYADELVERLKALKAPCLHVLSGVNTDSNLPVKSPSLPGLEEFTTEKDKLYDVIVECRVHKTAEELEILAYASKISSAAHVEVMRRCRPGAMEYQLESTFLHACYSGGGLRHASYGSISASGPGAAILHYVTNDQEIKDGSLVLADMGCQYYQYCADITTTFPANGKFSKDQAAVYTAVLNAHRTVKASMKPGVSWPEMHLLAERLILEGLRETGFVKGEIDAMLAARVGGLFMPHGLGHFLGIHVHDVGGYPPGGPPRPKEAGINRLRTARVLEEGMVITVEPGCYFNPVLLMPALENPVHSQFLVAERILGALAFGGVRIEDNVVITKNGSYSMTDVPRTVAEIEAVMAGQPWPLPTTAA